MCAAIALAASEVRAQSGVYAGAQEDGTLHLTDRPPPHGYRLVAGEPAARPVPPAPVALAASIERAAAAAGLDPLLVHAVVRVESAYQPRAVSPKGAAGLMQLMPATARRFGVADRFSVEDNLRGGTRYLRELLELFDGDLRLALASYNAGEGAVLRYGRRIPPYPESQAYVARVQALYANSRRPEGRP